MGRDQPRQKVGIFSGIYIQELLLLISCSFVVGQGSLSFFRPGSSGATDNTQENAAQGSAIYTVIATGGAGGYIYGVVSQTPPTPQFPFGTSSGELTSPTSLDAETTQQFTFVFNCTSGSETITSSQFVLDVRDVNDNTPHFLNLPYSVNIQNSEPTGSSIFTVTADDDDITPASLTYTITGGDTTNAFSLDSSSGVLTVAVSNNLQIGTQTLSVRVSDGTFTNTTSISVTISEDYCASTPCQNSGTCTNGPNSFLCACAPGWTGQTCSDPATTTPCYVVPSKKPTSTPPGSNPTTMSSSMSSGNPTGAPPVSNCTETIKKWKFDTDKILFNLEAKRIEAETKAYEAQAEYWRQKLHNDADMTAYQIEYWRQKTRQEAEIHELNKTLLQRQMT